MRGLGYSPNNSARSVSARCVQAAKRYWIDYVTIEAGGA
jgi:hypothetical protein